MLFRSLTQSELLVSAPEKFKKKEQRKCTEYSIVPVHFGHTALILLTIVSSKLPDSLYSHFSSSMIFVPITSTTTTITTLTVLILVVVVVVVA